MIDDEELDEREANVMIDEEEEEIEEGELSIMSLLGLAAAKAHEVRTMKLRGKVHGVPILLLVDSGATHNFISQKLVRAMGWQVDETTLLHIKLGDGYKAKTQGECKGVRIELENMHVDIDALLFDLDGIDIVLGMAWLNAIGEMWVDWPPQLMCFKFNNQWVELQGAGNTEAYHSALQSLIGKTRLCVDGLFMTAVGQVVGVPDQCRPDSAVLTTTQELEV